MGDISFHHVALTCESVARIEKFYCDNFSFSRKRAFQIGEGKEIVYRLHGAVSEASRTATAATSRSVSCGPPSRSLTDDTHTSRALCIASLIHDLHRSRRLEA